MNASPFPEASNIWSTGLQSVDVFEQLEKNVLKSKTLKKAMNIIKVYVFIMFYNTFSLALHVHTSYATLKL